MAYIDTPFGKMPVIHTGNYHEFIDPSVDGELKKRGLIPRPPETKKAGYYSTMSPPNVQAYSQADAQTLILQKDKDQSWLSDMRLTAGPNGGMIPSRDQNGKGFCWAHSGVSAHLLMRAFMGQPYADLSAYAIACQIKNFADQGGWGAQGVDWQIKNGVPTSKTWPQQSMSRANLTSDMTNESATHKINAQIADMDAGEYDRNLAYMVYVTLWIRNCATTCDFNWWSHSVCGCRATVGNSHWGRTRSATSNKLLDLQDFDRVFATDHPVTGGIATVIWNSWGDSWGAQGMGVLTGNHAIPDGGVGLLAVAA